MRKYFSVLQGNESSKARLGDAILSGRLPHALLFLGPEGSGKKTLARAVAMAVNCENKSSTDRTLPCGECNTCRRIRDNNFTDIMYIGRIGDKATIGVEEIRSYRDDMFLSPNESEHKIYIIEEADKLTEPAQNALLKVLEEPPSNVIIILLAQTQDKILTTIKSRVQAFNMQRFEFAELKDAALVISEAARKLSRTNQEAFEGIIMNADGRIGRALSLLSDSESKKSEEDRESVLRIVNAIRRAASYKELYSAIAALPKSRGDFICALELFMCAVRDIMLLKFDRDISLLFYTTRQEAQVAAKEINTKKLLSVYEAAAAALEDAGKNVSISAITSDLAAKIKLL